MNQHIFFPNVLNQFLFLGGTHVLLINKPKKLIYLNCSPLSLSIDPFDSSLAHLSPAWSWSDDRRGLLPQPPSGQIWWRWPARSPFANIPSTGDCDMATTSPSSVLRPSVVTPPCILGDPVDSNNNTRCSSDMRAQAICLLLGVDASFGFDSTNFFCRNRNQFDVFSLLLLTALKPTL